MTVSAFSVGVLPAAAQTTGALPDATPIDDGAGTILVPNTGRFVNVTRGFNSIGDASPTEIINIAIFSLVNSPQTNLVIDVFDGDLSPFNPNGATVSPTEMWDYGVPPFDSETIRLYPDPCRIGNTNPLEEIPFPPPTPAMDNNWTNVVDIPQVPAALNDEDCDGPGPGGPGPGDAYIYHFVTDWDIPPALSMNEQNNFKIRVQNGEAFILEASTVGFMGIGPQPVGFPNSHAATLYDGSWEWSAVLLAPPGQAEPCVLDIWDGDFDRIDDTDDLNSDPLPPFPSSPATCSQGVNDYGNSTCPDLAGCGDGSTGPVCNMGVDDNATPGVVQPPSVQYTVIGPAGSYTTTNTNPSGNREWELYRIASGSAFCLSNPDTDYTATADFVADSLIPGIHRIIIQGMDQLNTGFLNVNAELFTPQEEEECSDCDGKVTELTLQYSGPDNAEIEVIQQNVKHLFNGRGGKSGKQGPADPIYTDLEVDSGENFTFVGANDKGTFGPNITVCIDDNGNKECIGIHTSCSQPIGPGVTFEQGDFMLTVVRSYSRHGGLICPIEEPDF